MKEVLDIFLWLEDFDDTRLPDHDREDVLEEAVEDYNAKYGTEHPVLKTVAKYLRFKDNTTREG